MTTAQPACGPQGRVRQPGSQALDRPLSAVGAGPESVRLSVTTCRCYVLTGLTGGDDETTGNGGSLFGRFIRWSWPHQRPVVWALAGAGLIKAFLTLTTTLRWLKRLPPPTRSSNAAGDSALLTCRSCWPITSARYFKANELTTSPPGRALVYPDIIKAP